MALAPGSIRSQRGSRNGPEPLQGALGAAGAALLTLVGFQIRWANSHAKATGAHPGTVILKSGTKLFVA